MYSERYKKMGHKDAITSEKTIKIMLTIRILSETASLISQYTITLRIVKVKMDKPMLSFSKNEMMLKNGSVSF